ncbi:MAG: YqzL family protein [Clostridia bacterium]
MNDVQQTLWKLFEKTGNTSYYMLFKSLDNINDNSKNCDI